MSTGQLTGALESASLNTVIRAQLGAAELAESLRTRARVVSSRAAMDHRYYAWVALIGVLAVVAAVAWGICLYRGYRGFTGSIEVIRDRNGVRIGTRVECY
jgi:hypothetical protein